MIYITWLEIIGWMYKTPKVIHNLYIIKNYLFQPFNLGKEFDIILSSMVYLRWTLYNQLNIFEGYLSSLQKYLYNKIIDSINLIS